MERSGPAAQVAERILAAMRGDNPAVLESELTRAVALCRERDRDGPECFDLLAAVAEDMRQAEAARTAHVELLRHLAGLG